MRKLILAVLSFALLTTGFHGCKKAEKISIDALIHFYAGTVTINGIPVTGVGQKIKFGDIIATGDSGICKILIEDKTILQLKKNSELVYEISKINSVLQINKGWLAGITRKSFSFSKKYIIKTPTVTAAIRGTSYCIKIESADSSYFCVCNGTINLSGKGSNGGEDVQASHHKARRFKKDESGTILAEEAKMLYHGDEVIENLAKEIGETVDWTRPY